MRQILSNLKTGETRLAEVPAPSIEPGHVLIATRRSLVSQGTEKILVQFGKASLFQKARSQPEKVRQVLNKMRTEGVLPTLEAVFRRLDEPLPLGYSNAGVVIGVGEGVRGFAIGDRVASNGPHAEFVAVPLNLVAKLPDNVSDEAGAFTVVGAIGLQGIRLAKPELGELFVVVGLGLIGQITAQLLRAAGCRVIGLDFDRAKAELARTLGIESVTAGSELDPVRHVLAVTNGLGADGVIITASTSSNDVVAQSAQMSRKRGRIVLIGVVGLQLNRADFYEKELSFQVSCSYGPGRYDDAYEEKGYDYPPGFVRWTENRNFQAVLQAMSSGALQTAPLVTRRVALVNYREIYDQFDSGDLASLLVYDDANADASDPRLSAIGSHVALRKSNEGQKTEGRKSAPATTLQLSNQTFTPADGALAIVGAGNFAKMTLLPALSAANAKIKTIVSASGVTGTALARKYAVPFSSTDLRTVLSDPDIRGVIISTRHNLHAAQTSAALKAGKQVLVEKPLCLSMDELSEIEAALAAISLNSPHSTFNSATPGVTVGFNRRFSPHVEKIKNLLGDQPGPISLVATMNAGAIPSNHWVHDPEIGGGRLMGEACHFVDLALFVTGSPIVAVCALALEADSPQGDTATILLRHANGSNAVVNYFANGSRGLSKERIEIHQQGRSLLLDDFRELSGFGFKSFTRLKTRQDKGHARQFALFTERVRSGGPALIPWAEIANSTRAMFATLRSLASRQWVRVDEI